MTFELNEQHLIVIGKALGRHPYDEAAPVVAELQKQINAHQEAARDKAE